MKLDSRILEGKKPLDCFDVDIAKQFIGKKGYFSNSLSWYSVLKSTWYGTLNEIESQQEECFLDSESDGYFQYFLPEEWVKEPEKKYRPYTLAEWVDQHEIGEVIHFRDKDYKQKFNVMYTGYVIDNGEDIEDIRTTGRIMLIYTGYFLENLFEDYEICINGEWQPFGVLDEQGARGAVDKAGEL